MPEQFECKFKCQQVNCFIEIRHVRISLEITKTKELNFTSPWRKPDATKLIISPTDACERELVSLEKLCLSYFFAMEANNFTVI